jgi:hypothetical protein
MVRYSRTDTMSGRQQNNNPKLGRSVAPLGGNLNLALTARPEVG